MTKVTIKPETKRILEVIAVLERSSTARVIADKLDAYPSAITDLKKGRTNIGNKLIQKFTKEYDVNNNWLFTGEGEMFLNQSKSSFTGQASDSKMYIDDLVPTIMMIKEQNKLLQDEYKFLSEELKALKNKMLETLSNEQGKGVARKESNLETKTMGTDKSAVKTKKMKSH